MSLGTSHSEGSAASAGTAGCSLSGQDFRKRFDLLVLLAWTVPPVFGLSFLLYIRMFTPQQMLEILSSPLEPVFIIASLVLAFAYFRRYVEPIFSYLSDASEFRDPAPSLECMRRFPLHFWTIFLGYLLAAPSSVILSAETYTDFHPSTVDWFRIHLVALVVSIVVGLPIFFRVLDLFGRSLGRARLLQPQVSLKSKVFLVGALVPLLVDTMIVQYYWTRTGYFDQETFFVWLSMELLAIAGSILFLRSLGQSLQPLQGVLDQRSALALRPEDIGPLSTDELGVLAGGFRDLLTDLRNHREVLRLSARLLSRTTKPGTLDDIIDEVAALCRRAIGGDVILFVLYDEETGELAGISDATDRQDPTGYFHIPVDEPSLASWVFTHAKAAAVTDCRNDPRASPSLSDRLKARAAIAAPLIVEDRVIGVLLSAFCSEGPQYSDRDIAFLDALASEAARVVQTRTLYRRQAEAEALRRDRDDEIRLLLESTEQGIFGLDLEGNCTFVNSACLRMLGYGHEAELLGENMHRRIHHSLADGTPYPEEHCAVRLASQRGKPAHSAEEVHWRADGSSFPVEFWSRPMYKDDRIVGTVVTFVDITARKAAEEELRRLGEYNWLLLESTSDGIFGVDSDGRCTFVNHSAAAMLGYTPNELLGKDVHRLIHHSREDGTPIPRESCFTQRALGENAAFRADDDVLWRKDSTYFPVQYSANPIHEDGRVTGAVVVFRDIAEQRAVARRMDYLASHDPLTGLVNRRELERRLQRVVDAARDEQSEHVICYLDLDQFKIVNDSCGHVAGDELLRQLSALLQSKVRKSDTIGRLGGDEFGLLFESCPVDRALTLVDDLREVVRDYRFVWEEKTFTVGVSVGVVAIDADTESVASALSAADAACYIAKEQGRNRVHVCETDDQVVSERRSETRWVSRIQDAFDNGQFELTFQSILPLGDPGTDTGLHLEILTRMRGQDDEPILPGAFLPAAGRFQLMPRLDRWVIRETFRYLRDNHRHLDALAMCSINLSGYSLGDHELVDFIVTELKGSGLPPRKICFEISESAAVANFTHTVTFVKDLRAEGLRFALDDFGSGMSSFAYLKNLPVDFLKIDGHFVRDMAEDPVDRTMVEAINQIGHVMSMRTIAEFVESADVLDIARQIGVDLAQGYAISAAIPLSRLAEQLSQRSSAAKMPTGL